MGVVCVLLYLYCSVNCIDQLSIPHVLHTVDQYPLWWVSECTSGHQLAVMGMLQVEMVMMMPLTHSPMTLELTAMRDGSMLLCQPLLCHSSSTPVSDSSLEHCSSSPAALCAVYLIELIMRLLAVGPVQYFRKGWNRSAPQYVMNGLYYRYL